MEKPFTILVGEETIAHCKMRIVANAHLFLCYCKELEVAGSHYHLHENKQAGKEEKQGPGN